MPSKNIAVFPLRDRKGLELARNLVRLNSYSLLTTMSAGVILEISQTDKGLLH
jgi:hypothetical protein